jgi:hypothetical protein
MQSVKVQSYIFIAVEKLTIWFKIYYASSCDRVVDFAPIFESPAVVVVAVGMWATRLRGASRCRPESRAVSDSRGVAPPIQEKSARRLLIDRARGAPCDRTSPSAIDRNSRKPCF